jgi:outer membrane receptor for monomeric catechols
LYFPGLTRDQLLDRNGGLGDLVAAELESKGFEADLAFQPTKSLQIIFSYANNNEESTNGVTKGDIVSGHIKQQYSVLTKYTFVDGEAKGLSLGLGLQGAGQALQDYQTASSGARVARYNPSTFYAEFFAAYQFKAFGCNHIIQLNAKNLTKVDDVIGWKPAGSAGAVATQRYLVPTYAKFTLTYGIDF